MFSNKVNPEIFRLSTTPQHNGWIKVGNSHNHKTLKFSLGSPTSYRRTIENINKPKVFWVLTKVKGVSIG